MEIKEKFIATGFVRLVKKLKASELGKWGVMNAQEMVEHMSYAFRQANGKDKYELVSAEENLVRLQAFLMSDKEFKPNTKNVLLPEIAIPAQCSTMNESISELEEEIQAFFTYYKTKPEAVVMNPFFGELNYEKWVTLLYKHCLHHTKQFDLIQEA
jgi:hypothetical protein